MENSLAFLLNKYIGCLYHTMYKKHLFNNSIVFRDIKPQSLVASCCERTGSIIIAHFAVGKDKR